MLLRLAATAAAAAAAASSAAACSFASIAACSSSARCFAAAAAAPTPNQPLALWEIEANAMSLQREHRLLHELLRAFHNFNRVQCTKLRAEGNSSLSDLINWKFKDIRLLLENLSNRPTNPGGQQIGDKKIKELQALSWFITDRSRRGLTFDLNLYRQEASMYITYAEIDAEIGNDEAAVKPDKFKYVNWNKWEESVIFI